MFLVTDFSSLSIAQSSQSMDFPLRPARMLALFGDSCIGEPVARQSRLKSAIAGRAAEGALE
jgi:hypothetical protein